MKLLGSKEEETTKNKNAKKLPELEITKQYYFIVIFLIATINMI